MVGRRPPECGALRKLQASYRPVGRTRPPSTRLETSSRFARERSAWNTGDARARPIWDRRRGTSRWDRDHPPPGSIRGASGSHELQIPGVPFPVTDLVTGVSQKMGLW